MDTDVIMPALGMAQQTGKVLAWHRRAGESVTRGEPLMDVETDKVTVAIEAPASGILAHVTAAPGDDVPVGQVVAVIQARTGEATTLSAPPATPVAARLAAEHDLDLRLIARNGERVRKDDVLAHLDAATWDRRLPAGPPFDAETSKAPEGAARSLMPGGFMNPAPTLLGTARRVPASPKARRLAVERGVDVAALRGTGPGGAVLAADVLGAPATPAPMETPREQPAPGGTATVADGERPATIAAPPDPAMVADGELIRPSGAGQLMARRTAESFRDTPHFYLTRELPARALMEARERLLPLIEARAGVRLSFTDLLIRIMARTLAEHPLLNASWSDGAIQTHARVNLGVAAATPQGLLVPVIHDAAVKNLSDIARARRDLAHRAVAGSLTPDDLAGSTATLTNLGMYDVDMFQAIINPPNSMILAVGRIAERPVARDGAIVAAHTFWVTASFDHRIHDGARAAEFLRTFAAYVEEPLALL